MLAIVAASHPEAPLSPSLTTGLIQETTHRVWFSMVLKVLTQVLAIHYGTVWTCFDQKKTWGYWSAPRHFPWTLGTSSRNYRDFPQSFRAFLSPRGCPQSSMADHDFVLKPFAFWGSPVRRTPKISESGSISGSPQSVGERDRDSKGPSGGKKTPRKIPLESPKILQLELSFSSIPRHPKANLKHFNIFWNQISVFEL